MNCHLKKCSENTNHCYPGGEYTPGNKFVSSTLGTVIFVNVHKEDGLCKPFFTIDSERFCSRSQRRQEVVPSQTISAKTIA